MQSVLYHSAIALETVINEASTMLPDIKAPWIDSSSAASADIKLATITTYACMRRESWHLRDHVPMLRRLRWGALPFANLRFLNGPNDRLPWRCGKHFNDSVFQRFSHRQYTDCNWVGHIIRPNAIQPRMQDQVSDLTKDEWYDSLEMFTVSASLL